MGYNRMECYIPIEIVEMDIPFSWPHYPYCGIKHPEHGFGVLGDIGGINYCVFLISLEQIHGLTLGKILEDVLCMKYSDYQAIMDDGWELDHSLGGL